MKKKYILLLVFVLFAGLLTITGCGKEEEKDNGKKQNKDSTKEQETAKEEKEIEPLEYIVEFYDGDEFLFSKTVKENSTVEKPSDLEKKGYVFVAWYLGDKKFDFNTKITDNTTLKANWKKENVVEDKKTYTVTFELYDNNKTTQTVSEGKTAVKPTDPTRNGYTFKGWELNGEKYDFDSKITEDITIVAKWKKLSTIKEDTLSLATKDFKTLKNKFGIESNGIQSWSHYNTAYGRGYNSGGYVSFKNGYSGRFEFWTFEDEDYDTVLDSIQVKSLSVPLKDLFNDYSTDSLTDENLKAIGAKNILRVSERNLLQFVYGHYTIEVYNVNNSGYEQLSIWDDNYVCNWENLK